MKLVKAKNIFKGNETQLRITLAIITKMKKLL